MKQLIKSLIKVARLVSSDDTNSKFRFGRVTYQGQTSKANLFTPYGFYHNPPDGSWTVSYSQNGQQSNTLSMAVGGATRYHNLPKTGVKIGNPIIESYVDFDDLGNIEVYAPVDVNVEAVGDMTAVVGGDIEVTAGGTVTVNAADTITVTAPNIAFNLTGTSTFTIGGTTITIDASGITVTGGDVVADGVSLKTHVHGNVQSGSSNTGEPV